MLKKIAIASLCLLLPVLALAKGEGYGKTTWGMTPQQVISAEASRANLIEPQKYTGNMWGKAQINTVTIGSSQYTVNFVFDESDQLVQTNVVSQEQNNPGIAELNFENLNQLLTQKYGNPLFKGKDSVTWKTPDTTIELSKLIIPRVVAQVNIRYIPHSRVKSDTSNL